MLSQPPPMQPYANQPQQQMLQSRSPLAQLSASFGRNMRTGNKIVMLTKQSKRSRQSRQMPQERVQTPHEMQRKQVQNMPVPQQAHFTHSQMPINFQPAQRPQQALSTEPQMPINSQPAQMPQQALSTKPQMPINSQQKAPLADMSASLGRNQKIQSPPRHTKPRGPSIYIKPNSYTPSQQKQYAGPHQTSSHSQPPLPSRSIHHSDFESDQDKDIPISFLEGHEPIQHDDVVQELQADGIFLQTEKEKEREEEKRKCGPDLDCDLAMCKGEAVRRDNIEKRKDGVFNRFENPCKDLSPCKGYVWTGFRHVQCADDPESGICSLGAECITVCKICGVDDKFESYYLKDPKDGA